MALTHNTEQVSFYRTLIEQLRDDEWVAIRAFGPYNHTGACRDHDSPGWHGGIREKYAAGTRRKRVQKQVAKVHTLSDGGHAIGIEWEDV